MAGCEEAKIRQAMLERSVIASCIRGDVLPSQLALDEGHFTDALTRRLFCLMRDMERDRREIDLTNVCMADETMETGAVVSLAREYCVSTVLIRQNCELLRETRMRRAMETALEASLQSIRQGKNALESMESLRARLGELAEKSGGEQMAGRTMLELICELFDRIEQEQETPEETPVSVGIEKIDAALNGGFRRGELAVVCALTGVGKSAMLSFMMRAAAGQGKKILLISCEMSDRQNAERFVASIARVDMGKLIRGERFTEEESERLADGMAIYHPENIRVISSGTLTVPDVRREALRMKTSMGLDMIVVDYLQRMCPERAMGSKADETGSIASGLKSIAVDLNVPLLTAAQFNREAARNRSAWRGHTDEGVPALHQLRDSSQIEDEADVVVILDEPKRDVSSRVRRLCAYIAKNRSGRTGAVRLAFDPQTMLFGEGWDELCG